MHVELCRVATEDGLFLDGALYQPLGNEKAPLAVDAFLLVHGTGSNFYASGALEAFARESVAAGIPALRINTRGHDGMTFIPGKMGPARGGATYEAIPECRFDVAAWLDFLTEKGFSRIALVGHSMGGVKAIYSQAFDAHPSVQCVIGISPPRFCHDNFMQHPKAEAFRSHFHQAESLVAAGQTMTLMSVMQPLPMLITAGGFLAKYGPRDEFDYLRYLPELNCPALIIVGTKSMEASPALDGVTEAVARLQPGNSRISLEIVEGANTPYSGYEDVPFARTKSWLEGLVIS